MLKREWVVAQKCPSEQLNRIAHYDPEHQDHPLHPYVAQILYNRGIVSPAQAQAFFSEDGYKTSPFQMLGMQEAVERLRQAIRADELIAVYGDFDADGVSATALLVQTLRSLGASVRPFIPDRFEEGYGLNQKALCAIRDRGGKVVVTVDCGIRSVEAVSYAMQLGLDMIVTDHHSIGPQLPAGRAVIHPKQPNDPYPFKDFSGVGIAFKLAQALLRVESRSPIGKARPVAEDDLLDLVALGTVADIVPLISENRALVSRGLRKLGLTERPGLRALLAQAGARNRRIDAGTIAYFLGPRLNAAGRLEHAKKAYSLLTVQYPSEGELLASELEETNRKRQQQTELGVRQAREMLAAEPTDQPLLIVASTEFPKGIISLIASKLSEDAYRPAIAVHIDEKATESRGSARSIPEFNIVAALDECTDLVIRHGGHAAAAGFDVENNKREELFQRLRAIADRELGARRMVPTLHIDAEADLSEMDIRNRELLEQIKRLAPFGFGNREPVFVTYGVEVRGARIVGNEHLALLFSDGPRVVDGIAFRQKDRIPSLGQLRARVDIVYSISERQWNGEPQLQLDIKDIEPAKGNP